VSAYAQQSLLWYLNGELCHHYLPQFQLEQEEALWYLICSVLLESAGIFCIVDCAICWYIQFDCIWPTELSDFVVSSPLVLQHPPRRVLVWVFYSPVSIAQYHTGLLFKSVWPSEPVCFYWLAVLCLKEAVLDIYQQGLQLFRKH
jgi:hypothetical protein